MRTYLVIGLFFLFLLSPSKVFAESSYVLPYPSAMPGSIFYKLNLIQEESLKYWYFGDFGQFHYNLKQSDKYLVEAKTLFEYKQYFLGRQALVKSNEYFKKIQPALTKADSHGKDTSEKRQLLQIAKEKHIEVLSKMRNEVPESVDWQPETSTASNLDLWELILESINIRKA